MLVETAIRLVSEIQYKPGWLFTAEDATRRFENAIRLTVDYVAQETGRKDAEHGYPNGNQPYASFYLMVGKLQSAEEFYRKVMDVILDIEQHEAREYFRIVPTYWAPFHPHNEDGMTRWGRFHEDLMFGAA